MSDQLLYKIIYKDQDKIYEIYAKEISECEIFGFVEAEGIVFGKVTNPDSAGAQLKNEFRTVHRTYIPHSSVIRMDLVEERGVATIRDVTKGETNVRAFPNRYTRQPELADRIED